MRIFLSQPHGERLGDLLVQRLRDPSWQVFRAAVAFVKRSGVKHLIDDLHAFGSRAQVKMAVGVDLGGTSLEGLSALFESLEGHGEVWVVHNENGSIFHPKLYLFKNGTRGEVIVGSGNLTEGGLFDNYEASLAVSLDLTDAEDQAFLARVEAVLDAYGDETSGTSIRLTRETLDALTVQGYLPPEAYSRSAEEGPPSYHLKMTRQKRGKRSLSACLFRHLLASRHALAPPLQRVGRLLSSLLQPPPVKGRSSI